MTDIPSPIQDAIDDLRHTQDTHVDDNNLMDTVFMARREDQCQNALTDAICEWLHDEHGVDWNPHPTGYTRQAWKERRP